MLRKRSRLSLVGLDEMAGGGTTPRRSLSLMLCGEAGSGAELAAPWAGAAGSAPRTTAPENFFRVDESGSFLHARRTSSLPLLNCGGDELPGDFALDDDGGSPLDWEPSQAADAEQQQRGASRGAWGSDPDVASEESPQKRSAWCRFASALNASEGEAAAARAAEDAHLQRVGSGDVEGAQAWRARYPGGPAGAGAASGWGASPDAAASQPLSLSEHGTASQLLVNAPPLRCSFQAPAGNALGWSEGGGLAHGAPHPAFASQPHAAQPDGGAACDGGAALPYAGEAWHASQPPPFEFFSQRESQAVQAAHLPPPPFAGRQCGDASRTPPHYSMDSFMPHGCALDMSPGETGGSQYIASPLVHQAQAHPSQPHAPAEQPLAPHAADGSQSDAGASGGSQGPARLPLFPIFMPRGQKTLHLVRHGESEYNAACGAPGSSWDDPIIWDAPLSALGRSQASALGPALLAKLASSNVLWVASPLTRAIQTCLLARCAVLNADAARFPQPSQEQPWMVLRSELAEHLVTSGDVGRPASTLAAAFPELAAATFEHLPDTWWYNPGGDKFNCAARGKLQATEPRSELLRRCSAFRKWACARPEREMVVFGHSTFFKYFTNNENRLKNCEIYSFTL